MSRALKNKIGFYLGLILLSLGISPLTTTLFPQIGNIIEPFILLGVFLINKNNSYSIPFSSTFRSQISIIVLILLILFSFIGVFTPKGYQENLYKFIYADFRSCYLFIYTILLFFNNNWSLYQKMDFLKKILWIIIIWGFIYSYQRISENVTTDSIERTLGIPMHFLVIQNFLYYNKKLKIHLILLGMGAYYAVFSFARINIAFFCLQIFIVMTPLLLSKSNSMKQSVSKYIAFFLLLVAFIYFIPKAYDFYSSSEGGRAQINRIFGVTNSLSESEGERVKSLYVPFTDIDFFLIPEGIGWRNHIIKIQQRYNYKILSTQDSCWLYLFYHFGVLGGILSVSILFRYIFRFMVFSLKNFSIFSLERIYLLLAFGIGFFTQGVYFTVPQNAVAGGLMLALLSIKMFNRKSLSFKVKNEF